MEIAQGEGIKQTCYVLLFQGQAPSSLDIHQNEWWQQQKRQGMYIYILASFESLLSSQMNRIKVSESILLISMRQVRYKTSFSTATNNLVEPNRTMFDFGVYSCANQIL
jgi:hypothetical protein